MRCLIPALIVALLAGCSGSGSSTVPPPAWPELQEFNTDTLMMVGPDASMGNWSAVQKNAASPAFEQGVEKLAKSSSPSSVSGLKENAIRDLRALIAAAKSGAGAQELESSWKAAKDSMDKLTQAVEGT